MCSVFAVAGLFLSLGPRDAESFIDELRATRSFSNGGIEYEFEWTGELGAPGVEFGTHRFYGEDEVFTMHGAVIGGDRLPASARPYGRRSRIGAYQVSNSGKALSATVSDNGYDFGDPIWDVRQVGLYPDVSAMEKGDRDYLHGLAGRDAPVELRRESDGALLLTRLGFKDDLELRIWQDPARESQAVRSQLRSDGQVAFEARTQLTRWGDRWFPSEVEYFRATREGLAHVMTARIKRARFDDPAMEPLTLADAGIDWAPTSERSMGPRTGVNQGRCWPGTARLLSTCANCTTGSSRVNCPWDPSSSETSH
jgi:hypothetical protein